MGKKKSPIKPKKSKLKPRKARYEEHNAKQYETSPKIGNAKAIREPNSLVREFASRLCGCSIPLISWVVSEPSAQKATHLRWVWMKT